VKRCRGHVYGRTEAAERFGASVLGRHAMRDEIVDAFREKGAKLLVGIGVDLRRRAQRDAEEAAYARAKVTRAHGQLLAERAVRMEAIASK
jgi:hypothetical protein